MNANDPDRDISDADFERMVREAEQAASKKANRKVRIYHIRQRAKSRFGLIRTFQIPLPEITVDELAQHFAHVMKYARSRCSY